ncbi:hypothetical protein H4R19_001771 [Coemansia spiralis]|nr:hypothetical protein H4R19_001771 [Coemansia spiralis]
MVALVFMFIAACLRVAVVTSMEGRGGMLITGQVLRNCAICAWLLFFTVFIWWKKRKFVGKQAYLELSQSRKWKFLVTGTYMVIIGFIHFGDPSLVLMYGGNPAIEQYTKLQSYEGPVDPQLAFDATVGAVLYGFLTGLMVMAVSFKIKEKPSAPPS